MASKGSSNSINNYSEEDFMACNGNVYGNSEDTWRSGLELYDDEQTIFYSGSSHGISNRYQVYAMISSTDEEAEAYSKFQGMASVSSVVLLYFILVLFS
jgi:hypothetical protein